MQLVVWTIMYSTGYIVSNFLCQPACVQLYTNILIQTNAQIIDNMLWVKFIVIVLYINLLIISFCCVITLTRQHCTMAPFMTDTHQYPCNNKGTTRPYVPVTISVGVSCRRWETNSTTKLCLNWSSPIQVVLCNGVNVALWCCMEKYLLSNRMAATFDAFIFLQ